MNCFMICCSNLHYSPKMGTCLTDVLLACPTLLSRLDLRLIFTPFLYLDTQIILHRVATGWAIFSTIVRYYVYP